MILKLSGHSCVRFQTPVLNVKSRTFIRFKAYLGLPTELGRKGRWEWPPSRRENGEQSRGWRAGEMDSGTEQATEWVAREKW